MPASGKPALLQQIAAQIRSSSSGAIPFAEFMQLALYDPKSGYYAAGSEQRVGRGGDFYTSVSVGECFGRLLATHFLDRSPDLNQIVEQGANDGQLAADVLANLPTGIDYTIIEPFPALRAIQQEKLGDRPRWVESIEQIDGGICGQFVCNELLDAFPVHRVRLERGSWKELHVTADFEEIALPPSTPELDQEIALCLGSRQLPDGYTTEIHLEAKRWTETLTKHLHPGARATIIDYGHEADDYYAPQRNDGTLRGYRDHRQITRYLERVGETDLTSSVNFTRIAEIAGAPPATDQHHFLVDAARSWLAQIESKGTAPDPETQKLLRQFQTLIHPGLMGQSFKVLEIYLCSTR